MSTALRKLGLFRRSVPRLVTAAALVAASVTIPVVLLSTPAQAADPCATPVTNVVACENTKPGTPNWQVNSDDSSIVGFTTDISTTAGGSIGFKVNTDASNYDIYIFRLGYYQGIGARQVADLPVRVKTTQPACATDSSTGLVDCGNWAASATWQVPANTVTGLYYAVLHRNDTQGENEMAFVVRDDSSHSDIVYQTSDETWEAYNTYGGNSLYTGTGPGDAGAAYKVSYNRPLSGEGDENFIFNAEFPQLYFLEENGYNLSYTTDVDSARNGALIKNHKIFMAVGHDEYWSDEQRASVENARAAGVNLAFFTGNEVFWKTRWENSIDGSNTPYRTVVCYKETKANAKIDPSTLWTGSWRDPRFSPPSDGGRPENALLGQQFGMNGYRQDSLQVPAAYGQMRLWRNTALATMTPGSTYTFQPGTLGYEWDTLYDNGSQPPGMAQLSNTTVTATGDYVLKNYGDLYGPSTLTHEITEYRATSGALVFDAGTVQWAWGLSDNHAFQTNTPTSDPRMQQATVNLMADMGAQPATLMAGMVTASASNDTMPPSIAITSAPTPVVGANYTFSGSVFDIGGQVAGVEASSDGGSTWHEATWQAGSNSWSYSFVPAVSGPITIEVRAVDDSANLSAPTTANLTVNARTCPCGVFPATSAPANPAATDGTSLELGMQFQSSQAGYVQGVRFYKGTGNTGTHTGSLWSTSGKLLATGTFTNETASGWQQLIFPRSVAIAANTTYVVSYHAPNGHYAADSGYFTNGPAVLQPMTGLRSTATTPNGVYAVASATTFPTSGYQDTNYWVDAVFATTAAPNVEPPNVVSVSPPNNQGSVALTTAPSITFDEGVVAGSLQFTVSSSAGSVAGSVVLSNNATTATFTPSQALAAGTTYTVSVRATDSSGNQMPSPYTWSFTTGTPRPATCPCSVWDGFATPAITTSTDTASIEVGTKVRFDVKGQVTGVRFYKGLGNSGTHIGSLWSASGQRLATGTFSNETASGWQTLTFSSPVNVLANTTYVVSYYAPTGGYSASPGYFGNNTASYNQLHALADGTDGGNGVYHYGSGSSFPTNSYNSTNYWVDVLWQPGANGDATPPSVVSSTPGNGEGGVDVDTTASVTFNEPVDLSTAAFTVADPGGAYLTGALSISGDQKTVTFTPSAPLAPGTRYTATLQIADLDGGNLMASPYTWTFTPTSTVTCPCSLFSAATVPTTLGWNDPNPYELGVRFSPSVNGTISGVRFYKGPQNTGTHTGSLWSATGQQLATGTFSNETGTGWQTLTFATPVAVTAGQTYVASYTTTTGYYSGDAGYFTKTAVNSPPLSAPLSSTGAPNGVYQPGSGFPTNTYNGTNYWVDVVFNPS